MSTIDKQEYLRSAALNGRINDVKKYLSDDAVDVNGKDYSGWTALHHACYAGQCDIAELLLDHGADIDARTDFNYTPLMYACRHDHASTLLERGAKVNAVNDYGMTALHQASFFDSEHCVEELLAYGADTTIKNNKGKTPLDLAKEEKKQSIIEIFMKHEKHSEKSLVDSNQGVQIMSELVSTIQAQASCTGERLLKVEAVIGSLREELHQDMVANKEDMKETAKKLSSELERKVETIINLRSEELCDQNSSNQDKMNQSLDKLTNQLSISNAETAKCFSNLATMIGHLSTKISSIEGRLDKNEEVMKRNQEQMYPSLQRLTSDHLLDSNENARADADADADAGGIDSERQKDVENCEKEEDSLSVLINIQDELHQSLTYCQSMLSS